MEVCVKSGNPRVQPLRTPCTRGCERVLARHPRVRLHSGDHVARAREAGDPKMPDFGAESGEARSGRDFRSKLKISSSQSSSSVIIRERDRERVVVSSSEGVLGVFSAHFRLRLSRDGVRSSRPVRFLLWMVRSGGRSGEEGK
jgi:hypothetical protein